MYKLHAVQKRGIIFGVLLVPILAPLATIVA
jgi:hypothetical protein